MIAHTLTPQTLPDVPAKPQNPARPVRPCLTRDAWADLTDSESDILAFSESVSFDRFSD